MASFGRTMEASAIRPGQQAQVQMAHVAAAMYGVPGVHGGGGAGGGNGAPQGTFAPGTKIQVGSHRVVIQKYLSEGGFAHVYLVKLPAPVDGTDLAVLKRVAVPDKEALRGMRTEVETMKRLKGHQAIVTYIDSHASELRGGGGYEVFLLMEYCDGGGLMDFMNTRLQHRLTEPEILSIFIDVAEGVACMHYLRPPLLHRDLKVENVLISKGGGSSGHRRRFKLCDFGSAAPPRAAPTSAAECRLVDEDVQCHTTLQYRSPEMIDVYRRQPIDEKSDIWALGVLLYKLCYYTTPFEDQSSQLAILNASYRFPSHPVFSDRLKRLIASMLRENQQARPNIYQILREACSMHGRETPIKDIYGGRAGESRLDMAASKPVPAAVVGAVFAPVEKEEQVIPDIVPMRRGRPAAAPPSGAAALPSQVRPATRPSPSPMRVTSGDPFAALDAKATTGADDELSARFPTLDQFSLLHDQGTRFTFEETAAAASAAAATAAAAAGGASGAAPEILPKPKDIGQRVAERLADDAFAASAAKAAAAAEKAPVPLPVAATRLASTSIPPITAPKPLPPSDPVSLTSRPYRAMASTTAPVSSSERPAIIRPSTSPRKSVEMSRASAIISSTPELLAISAQTSDLPQQQRQQQQQGPQPQAQPQLPPRPKMVSTGTMTSPSPPPPQPLDPSFRPNQYPLYRFPSDEHQSSHLRASSVPRKQYQENRTGSGSGSGAATISSSSGSGSATSSMPAPTLAMAPSWSQPGHIRHPSSSRPSLELSRPSLETLEVAAARVPTPLSMAGGRPRPVSTYLESNMDYLREREASGGGGQSSGMPPPLPRMDTGSAAAAAAAAAAAPIESNVDFLRSMEENNNSSSSNSNNSDSKRDHHHLRGHNILGRSSTGKRASLTALSGTKNILAGKFGDAFKRFETSTGGGSSSNSGSNNNSDSTSGPGPVRTPSPLKQLERQDYGGNTAEEDTRYDEDNEEALEMTDDMPPEVRREVERRRLSMEEKRVARAGAEYRQRLAQRSVTGTEGSGSGYGSGSGSGAPAPPLPLPKSIGGVSRAVSIQNRVQNLLNESKSGGHVTRTAQGYGHFTDDGSGEGANTGGSTTATASANNNRNEDRSDVYRKPPARSMTASSSSGMDGMRPGSSAGGGGIPPRPPTKPKPMHLNMGIPMAHHTGSGPINAERLRTGSSIVPSSSSSAALRRPINVGAGANTASRAAAAAAAPSVLMAPDLPGQPVLEDMTLQDKDDYIRDFTRRFPSLTSIEMVERDLGAEAGDR